MISRATKLWRLCWDERGRSKDVGGTGGGTAGNIGVEMLASTYRLRSHKLESGLCIWHKTR